MKTITLNLTIEKIEKLKNSFAGDIVVKKPPYSLWQVKTENCTITAYESLKVVFQGNDAEIYASAFKDNSFIEQAGSDEVGTGDYLGPVTVCACIVKKGDEEILKSLNVQDSKEITDNKILEIAPKLMERLNYSLLILDNKKYNEIHKSNNLNAIKAKLHNKAYVNLSKKVKLPDFKIIDQFTPKNLYYNYIKNEKEIIYDINFETKAENKYLSVACASIIARYAFLKKWEEMEKRYNFKFIKGASESVDQNVKEFIQKFGFKELTNIAKLHFKNTERIKNIAV